MINWTHTNHAISGEYEVLAADLGSLSAGMAVAPVFEAGGVFSPNYPGGVGKVKKTDGTTTDTLAGVALAPKKSWGYNMKIEQIVVPASPYTVLLSKVASGSIGASRADTGALVTVSGSAASSTNIQSGTDSATGLTSLVFDSSFAGVVFNISYKYATTTIEDEMLFGQPYPGWTQADQLGMTGVLTKGRVATNNFDPLADWYASGAVPKLKCIAGGIFSSSAVSTAGFVPTNARIISKPTYLFPWLVIELS